MKEQKFNDFLPFQTRKYINTIFLYFLVSAETYLVKSTSNNMFYCKLCEYVAKLRYDVIRHVESKHLDLKYTCYYCNAILKTKRSYQNHLRHYHPNQHHANIQWITEYISTLFLTLFWIYCEIELVLHVLGYNSYRMIF